MDSHTICHIHNIQTNSHYTLRRIFMKHAINILLKNTDVLCHEVRFAKEQPSENSWLLHFLLCHDKDGTRPYFAMGYEYYTPELNSERRLSAPLNALSNEAAIPAHRKVEDVTLNKEVADEKTPYGYISGFGMITPHDTNRILFNSAYQSQHTSQRAMAEPSVVQATVAQHILHSEDGDYMLLSEHVEAQTTTDPTLSQANRNVREMTDSALYGDTGKTTDLSTQPNYQANDGKHFHGIWNADIHWSKTHEVDISTLYELFDKYQPYIGKSLPANLPPDSQFNVEMEQIFGASFDVERLKTGWFRKHEKDKAGTNEFYDSLATANYEKEKV
jgi:hypothetical protein